MKRFMPILFVLGLIGTLLSSAQAINLAKNGKTSYVIVTPADKIPVEVTAAKELQEHLKLMTGANFKIISENAVGKNKNLILVGQTAQAKKLLPGTDWKALGNDGIILRTIGSKIILTGGRKRGGLYAVYTFLEDNLGVRWWSHNERTVPKKTNLNIGKLDTSYVPKILCREAHFYEPNNYGIYAARTKQTGHFHPVPPEYGGHYNILGWCHTFYQLLPPSKYFAQHPEWYSMINGRRTADGAQLCLNNEEMRKELVKNALEWIKKNPEAGIISIAQNDCGGACQCPECSALQEKEGSPSGPLINFVNKVADDINKVYPNFLIETLAYQYTRKAPKFAKPGKNVLVRLCSIECDYGLKMTDPRDKSFADDLAAWSAISHNLYIWTYIASFGNYQYPNPCLPVYETNIRMFEKNKAIGVFMQGDSYNEATCFVRLRSWVLAHLMWNPALEESALVKEFMDGYYGPASPYLTEYLGLIDKAYADRAAGSWFTPEYMFKAQELFNKAAEAVKSDPAIANRVRRERLPLDYLWITNYSVAQQYAEDNNIEFLGPKDPIAAVDEFQAASAKYNNKFFSEGGPLEPYFAGWKIPKLKINPVGTLPTELGDLSNKKYVDIQENRYMLHGEGNMVKVLEDPDASNKVAAVMTGEGTQWATQVPITTKLSGKQHIYASVKIDATPGASGTAFQVGMYDTNIGRGVFSNDISLEQMAGGKYVLLDLGTWDLKAGMYIWFAPVNNPDIVKGIYTDRVLFVAE